MSPVKLLATNVEPRPPIGWADLECFLIYRSLTMADLPALTAAVQAMGFTLRADAFWALSVELDDLFWPLPHLDDVEGFAEHIEGRRLDTAGVNFEGNLSDIRVHLSLMVHPINQVAVLSVPENMLWAFSEDTQNADFRRL